MNDTARLDDWDTFVRALPARLSGRDEIGPAFQGIMSPRPRHGWTPGILPPGCRQAAVLVLLYPYHNRPTVLLTLRRADLETHAGQVSLPGGSLEPAESYEAAAVREAHEEVGLDPASVRVLGRLTPLHIPASTFHLHPIVGTCADHSAAWHPCEAEVDRLLHVPLAALTDPQRVRVEVWQIRGRPAVVPYFAVEDQRVWGATAMVLAELLSALGAPPEPPFPPAGASPSGDTLGSASCPAETIL